MADEADHDGEMVDFILGNLEIRVVMIYRTAEDGILLVEDALEDNSLGRVEDMGTPPLDELRLLNEDAGKFIAGEDIGGHGVAPGNDREVIIRESGDKRKLFALQRRDSRHSHGQSSGSCIERNARSSLPFLIFRKGGIINFDIRATIIYGSGGRDIIFTLGRIGFYKFRIYTNAL